MILFRTMIPVASDFTKEDFFELLKIDVISPPNSQAKNSCRKRGI